MIKTIVPCYNNRENMFSMFHFSVQQMYYSVQGMYQKVYLKEKPNW